MEGSATEVEPTSEDTPELRRWRSSSSSRFRAAARAWSAPSCCHTPGRGGVGAMQGVRESGRDHAGAWALRGAGPAAYCWCVHVFSGGVFVNIKISADIGGA